MESPDYRDLAVNGLKDPVTGLLSHSQFLAFLEGEIERTRSSDTSIGLLMIDPDGFGKVNSEHGYEAGDAALRRLGEVIQATLPNPLVVVGPDCQTPWDRLLDSEE